MQTPVVLAPGYGREQMRYIVAGLFIMITSLRKAALDGS